MLVLFMSVDDSKKFKTVLLNEATKLKVLDAPVPPLYKLVHHFCRHVLNVPTRSDHFWCEMRI